MISDVGAVCKSSFDEEEFFGDIVGVVSCSKFCSCILCEAKVKENGVVGSKCGLKQKSEMQ